jgi:hypothetical protein
MRCDVRAVRVRATGAVNSTAGWPGLCCYRPAVADPSLAGDKFQKGGTKTQMRGSANPLGIFGTTTATNAIPSLMYLFYGTFLELLS